MAGDSDRLDRALVELFGHVPRGERFEDLEAVHHIFRIASGLESAILGEREVWTQFRQAVTSQKGRLDGFTLKLLEQAIATGRAIRDLLPPAPHGSLAAIAVGLIGKVARVAVLGSGIMAKAAVSALQARPQVPAITVVARSPEKVSIEDVSVRDFTNARDVLADFPVVIAATSAKQRLIESAELAAVLRNRTSPLLLIDLAMPPDFDPPEDSPIRYVAIDELADLVARRPEMEVVTEEVSRAALAAWQRFANHDSLGPTIAALYATADEVVERTVERFVGRLSEAGDREVLKQTAHTVARTLIAGPVSQLHRLGNESDMASLIAEAFSDLIGDSDG